MTTLTDTQVITASGGLVELGYANLTANATITAAVASPALVTGLSTTVVCDGSPVMVEFFTPSLRPPATAGQEIAVNLFVDGSSYGSIANAYNPASNNDNKPAYGSYRLTPTAGSHTFDIRAGVTSGATGYINSGNNSGGAAAFIRVSKIVQATQWPAVTTGTIICTSSTRPASPFEGQTIYETDTKRSWTRVGTQWVPDDMVFTNEAARDAAITSPTEGMRAYLTAPTVPAATGDTTAVPTGITTIYNGSAWVCVTPVGASTPQTGTTSSTSYTPTLGGVPGTNVSVTLSTGTTALLSVHAGMAPTTVAATGYASLAVSGASTVAASDNLSVFFAQANVNYLNSAAGVFVISGLTAGTNTFTLNYRTSSGTHSFMQRRITVQGIA